MSVRTILLAVAVMLIAGSAYAIDNWTHLPLSTSTDPKCQLTQDRVCFWEVRDATASTKTTDVMQTAHCENMSVSWTGDNADNTETLNTLAVYSLVAATSIQAGNDGAVAELPARLGHQAADGAEERCPRGIGGGSDHDLAGLNAVGGGHRGDDADGPPHCARGTGSAAQEVGVFSTVRNYIGSRSNFVRSRIPTKVPFSITTNSGEDFQVDSLTTELAGRAWIDVRTVLVDGRDDPLDLSWSSDDRWSAELSVFSGANNIESMSILAGIIRSGNHLQRCRIQVWCKTNYFAQRIESVRVVEIAVIITGEHI